MILILFIFSSSADSVEIWMLRGNFPIWSPLQLGSFSASFAQLLRRCKYCWNTDQGRTRIRSHKKHPSSFRVSRVFSPPTCRRCVLPSCCHILSQFPLQKDHGLNFGRYVYFFNVNRTSRSEHVLPQTRLWIFPRPFSLEL